MTPRVWATVAFAVLVAALGVTLLVLVPWQVPPAPRVDQLQAIEDMPADRVALGKELSAVLRPGSYASMVVALATALILGLTPWGARLVSFAGRPFGGHWLARAILGGLLVVLVAQLVLLPFGAWRHVVLVNYELDTRTWAGWLVDLGKSYLVTAVLGAIVLAGFYTLTRLAPRWWWAWAAVGAAALAMVLSFVYPVLIEPVFNKFTPMPASNQLRSEVMALASRDGVPVKDVLVADASRRTRAVNAYVSGLGPTRRVVVYDTLLDPKRGLPPEEIRMIVAHELGHAKYDDVFTGTVIGALGAATGVVGLYILGGWGWLLRRAGIEDLADPRGVAFILAASAVVGLVVTPVQSLVSRRIEARADHHALELTADPQTFEFMQRRLGLTNLSDVDPPALEHIIFGSHPTTVERVAAARAYGRDHKP